MARRPAVTSRHWTYWPTNTDVALKPGQCAVYLLSDDCEGQHVVYVGITEHPATRWKNHKRRRPWAGQIRHWEIRVLRDRESALRYEAELIEALQPAHNWVGVVVAQDYRYRRAS